MMLSVRRERLSLSEKMIDDRLLSKVPSGVRVEMCISVSTSAFFAVSIKIASDGVISSP